MTENGRISEGIGEKVASLLLCKSLTTALINSNEQPFISHTWGIQGLCGEKVRLGGKGVVHTRRWCWILKSFLSTIYSLKCIDDSVLWFDRPVSGKRSGWYFKTGSGQSRLSNVRELIFNSPISRGQKKNIVISSALVWKQLVRKTIQSRSSSSCAICQLHTISTGLSLVWVCN